MSQNNFIDGKISLVNEKSISPPKINHLQKRTLFINSNSNVNENIKNTRFLNFESSNLNNENDTENVYNLNTENNSPFQQINHNFDILNEEEQKNYFFKSNDNMTFQNGSQDYQSQINSLNIDNLRKELEEKNVELKKMSDLFDQLKDEYSKLNAKYNSLNIYASDLKKQIDMFIFDKNQSQREKDDITIKIIQEKDNIISVLQNQVNYYKDACNSINKTFFSTSKNQNNFPNEFDNFNNHYIQENKKLKNQLKQYSSIDFNLFESQINIQIDNFNNILNNYNKRLNESLSQIPEFFNKNQKEEAAKYLVKQINEFMSENQKLLSDNFKLNIQVNELQAQLKENKKEKKESEKKNDELENKVEELESLIQTLSKTQINQNSQIETTEIKLRECLSNTMNELKEKDKIIAELKTQLMETINKHSLNFDERQIVNSMSRKLYEKDTLIQSLKNQLDNGIKRVDEIKKNKDEFLSKIK